MLSSLSKSDALIIIDVQNDFCPGGSLPVPEGDQVVPVLNRWIEAARRAGALVVASRDWHPPGHASFAERGGPWPPHCVQGTKGAELHPRLELPADAAIVSKGMNPDKDNYSDFKETDLAARLRAAGVRRLWVGGLAQDYCVRATVLDGLREGFEVHLIRAATRPVDLNPGDGERALEEMRSAGAIIEEEGVPERGGVTGEAIDPLESALFTDLYELTMFQAYVRAGMRGTAVFELFFRVLPPSRNYVVACGLDDALTHLERARITAGDLAYLREQGLFSSEFLAELARFRFTGDVYAVPEGTVVFENEPLLQVVASLPEAQLVETCLMNQVHFQSAIASKASRIITAAAGRPVVDFGARRAHGADAALKLARASWIAGAAGTSNLFAGKRYGIPVFGTMAHSYVQAHDDELEAFRDFASLYPGTTLLVDTYDTLEGVRKVIELRRRHRDRFDVSAVRLDSGDLEKLSREARRLLDRAGLQAVKIIASSGLDEHAIAALLGAGAPIDGFGVGSKLSVAEDAPTLDFAYKLVEYGGEPRLKLSPEKRILPGRKQVFRTVRDGVLERDVLARHGERLAGEPLLVPVMRGGRRLPAGRPDLAAARARARAEVAQLPPALRALAPAAPRFAPALSRALADEAERLGAGMSPAPAPPSQSLRAS